MMRPPEKDPTVVDLSACCAEAQADGVPCPTLCFSCEECERAMTANRPADREGDPVAQRFRPSAT
jgi:hypothetical protein